MSTILVWRHHENVDGDAPLYGLPHSCYWCGAELNRQDDLGTQGVIWNAWVSPSTQLACRLCGWTALYVPDDLGPEGLLHSGYGREAYLMSFAHTDTQLALNELGTHLKRHFSDIYSISWQRFEALVADVFSQFGFRCILTQATRDGGADIILVEQGSTDVRAIVECKRYAKERKIGVSQVRSLVGAAVEWNVRRAMLVTSSSFTSVASAMVPAYQVAGYNIDLVAASDLLSLLGVYNEELPRLENLTESVRREIARANTETGSRGNR